MESEYSSNVKTFFDSNFKRIALDKIGVKLITKVRKNMKMKKRSKTELALLRCRGVIETTIGQLKEMHHIENTKLRSVYGWIMNLIGTLIAYQIKPFKPSIKPVILSKYELKRI